MKIRNLKTHWLFVLGFVAFHALPVLAQPSLGDAQPTEPQAATSPAPESAQASSVPTTVNAPTPSQPSLSSTSNPTPPAVLGDNKEIPSADSVLSKLKQNSSPVTVSDMIAAQDVISRLDIISQIEDKMAKIEEARNKRVSAAPVPPPAPPVHESAQASAAAIEALKEATPPMPMPAHSPEPGNAQVLTVSGGEGNYSALIQVEGNRLNVRSGTAVPGMGIVTSINPKEVIITRKNGKTAKLSFTEY